ncbi:MAG TPA: murein L,D-transpeptidase catalytic domain family protein [Gemmatimonadales bacterium]|nr:murein L,D-transpeptidase catalytic domain family protein [Gemmatimonadales bacterium]
MRQSVHALAVASLFLGQPATLLAAADPMPGSADRTRLEVAAERAGLRREVLSLAVEAHARVIAGGLTASPRLTVIDYSLASRQPRLWVLDLARGEVLAHELVAHGRGTGDDTARSFSNRPGSLQSSLGTFVTGKTYRGRHGLALRLRGLDPGLNDRAEARAIVVHGADYVSLSAIERLGRLGRSRGCPALSPGAARRVIELIRDGTVVFAYHPSAALERALRGRVSRDPRPGTISWR